MTNLRRITLRRIPLGRIAALGRVAAALGRSITDAMVSTHLRASSPDIADL